jgi:hypothetical protein
VATLDRILDQMAARKARVLTLAAGEIPQLHAERGALAVGSAPMTDERVLAYLRELAGPAERAALEAREDVTFAYRGFLVAVAFLEGRIESRITPAAAEEPAAEAGAPVPEAAVPAETVAAAAGAPAPAADFTAAERAEQRAAAQVEADRAFDPRAAGEPPVDELFRDMIRRNASDLHLTMGQQIGRAHV